MPDRHLDAFDYKKIFRDREKRLQIINKLGFIPTVPYLKLVYRIKTGRRLNLKNPILFSEKENWLKLHDIRSEYTNYVDKLYMKKYIADKFGSEHIIPCLGSWNHFVDIDFDSLPNSFVLKCTHDSGSAKVIKDKDKIDKKGLEKFFEGRLKINSYNLGREYPYRNVPRKIMAEEYHEAKDGTYITDLKIMCFNGKVKAFYFISGKGINGDEILTWFDETCKPMDLIDKTGERAGVNVPIPPQISDIFDMAEKLSAGIPFVRVDFFVDGEEWYFAEMTFYNNGGFVLLEPEKWEYYFGELISIEGKK